MTTPLGELYDALGALKEQELTALAEAHMEDSTLLINRFLRSVENVGKRDPIDLPFYESPRKTPTLKADVEVKSTIDFAAYLYGGHPQIVINEPALEFRYVDREIFPARNTAKDEREARRSLDLLLANVHDNTPVLGELKIRSDKPAYYALVQLLMLAAEFISEGQRTRLARHYPGKFERLGDAALVDLYIIAFDLPDRGRYRERSFKATKRISKALLDDARVARHVRRIAYLEALIENKTMGFKKLFAFGAGV